MIACFENKLSWCFWFDTFATSQVYITQFLAKNKNMKIIISPIASEYTSVFLNSFLMACYFRHPIFPWLVCWWAKLLSMHTDNHFRCRLSCLTPVQSIRQPTSLLPFLIQSMNASSETLLICPMASSSGFSDTNRLFPWIVFNIR